MLQVAAAQAQMLAAFRWFPDPAAAAPSPRAGPPHSELHKKCEIQYYFLLYTNRNYDVLIIMLL